MKDTLSTPHRGPVAPPLAGAASVLAIAVYCALLLRKTFLAGDAMLGYDLYNYFYPAKAFVAESLRRGELPLWNPDAFLGVPFLANIQMAVLYPPDLLFVALDFSRAVAASQWLHLTLAGAGMFALGRYGWRLDALASLAGGIAFVGSGFFAGHMGHLNQVHASTWLPWVALAQTRLASDLDRWLPARRDPARARPVLIWLLVGSAAVALQITAGHTQETYYSLFALGLLALAYTVFPPASAPARLTHLPAIGALAAGGMLLAAVQLLPTLELAALSYRQGGVPLEEALVHSVDRTHVLETVLPTFWSLPSQEILGYIGVVALPLVLAAVAVSPARRTVLALAGLAGLALVLSLGAYTPLYPWMHQWLPVFASFRAPGRWLLISTFALCGLAAHGLAALRPHPDPAVREARAVGYGTAMALLAGGLVLFVVRTEAVGALQWVPHGRVAVLWALAAVGASALGVLAVFSRPPWPRLMLIGALALELGTAAREMEYNLPGSPDLYHQAPAIASYLADRLGSDGPAPPERVVSLAVEERFETARLQRLPSDLAGDSRRYAAMREALKPNLGARYGVPTIDGYDGGLLPTQAFAHFKAALLGEDAPVPHLTLPAQAGGKADARLYRVLNVRYLLTDGRYGHPGVGWDLVEEAPGVAWVYRTQDVSPRAFVVPAQLVEVEPTIAARRLRTLDPRQAAIVPLDLGLPPFRGGSGPVSTDSLPGTATITRYAPRAVDVAVTAPAAGLLVLTDSYYPGWTATVDGRPAHVLAADVVFRAVAVPTGTSTVRFRFEPWTFRVGAAISTLALLAGLLAATWCVRTFRVGSRPWRRKRG